MKHPLKTFIARLVEEEKREKAAPKDWRLGGSILFLVPIFLWLFAHLGSHFLDNAGVAMIWLYSVTAGLILLLATSFCVRMIPTKGLFILAAIAWVAFIWAAGFHRYF
jgi:hypothetical protein